MDKLNIVMWIAVLTVIMSTSAQGAFKFDEPLETHVKCVRTHGKWSLTLKWNYITDETVTVIEWYKQPGVLIARIFGVNQNAPFSTHGHYNTDQYNVTNKIEPEHNTAIQITEVSENDTGVYSVNVTAASPQSAVLNFTFSRDCIPCSESTTETMPKTTITPTTEMMPKTSIKHTTVKTTTPQYRNEEEETIVIVIIISSVVGFIIIIVILIVSIVSKRKRKKEDTSSCQQNSCKNDKLDTVTPGNCTEEQGSGNDKVEQRSGNEENEKHKYQNPAYNNCD